MKTSYLFVFTFLLGSFAALAQDITLPIVHEQRTCGTNTVNKIKMNENVIYKQRLEGFDKNFLEKLPLTRINRQSPNVGASFTIPVVVHVMHKGEAVGTGTNLSEQAIKSKIRVINEQFRKIAGSTGDGNGIDMEIEFALAVRNPSGSCTSAINRVNMSSFTNYMANGVNYENVNGMSDGVLKALSYWPSNQYYNIWIVSEIDNNDGLTGIIGYAYYANAHGENYDGIIICSNSFGDPLSSSETHELGHALNLYHTFEGDDAGNNCPVGNGCGLDVGDCCSDIPPHKRTQTNCDLSESNECDGNSPSSLFINNYMSYSPIGCTNMFTENQKDRALSAIVDFRSSYLASSGNNKLIPSAAPVANFFQSSQIICIGEQLQFYDNSSCTPNTFLDETSWNGISFSWTISNGSTTLTSSLQNPKFTFTQPGNYNITYTVTNPWGSNTKTVVDGIYVKPAPVASCTPTSFNVGNFAYTVHNVSFNSINNSTSNLFNDGYVDFSCSKSTVLQAGTTYPLSVSLRSFNLYTQNCQVYIDYNNNGFWELSEKVLDGSIPVNTSSTITANVSIPTNAVQNTLLRMRVIGEADVLQYGQEVNCSGQFLVGDVEDYGVIVMPTLESEDYYFSSLRYYPNPTNDIMMIHNVRPVEHIDVFSIVGQKVHSKTINDQNIVVDMTDFAQGTYFVKLYAGNDSTTIKMIKK